MAVEVGGGQSQLPDLLNGVDRLFVPLASKAVAASLSHIEELQAPYPPQPPRDRGSSFNTYVRGVGFYPRSAFKADPESPGGYKTKRKTKKLAGEIRYTSEQMDKRYVQRVRALANAVEGVLRNEASYSGYVIGDEQTAYHKADGWPYKEDVLTAAQPFIDAQADAAIQALMDQLAGAK